jgi:hypothetical protein
MRPGPATQAALVWRKSCCPFPRTRHGGVQPSSPSLRRVPARMPLNRWSLAKRASRNDLQHYGGQQPVLPCVEDSLRRPQRPGNQSAPKRVSGGTLPIIHPRELPRTAGSAAMLWQGMQEISLECRLLCARTDSASRENLSTAVQKL